MNAGFYKVDQDGIFLFGRWVAGPYNNFVLLSEERGNHTYPVDGWYWFDSKEEAIAFFGLPTDALYLGELPQDV